MKLRTKLIGAFSGLVLFCAILIAIPVTLLLRNTITKSIKEKCELQMDGVYKTLDIFLANPINDINAAASFIKTEGDYEQFLVENYFMNLIGGDDNND